MLSIQTFMVMNRCNLACNYCYYEEGSASYEATVVAPAVYNAWLARCSRITDVRQISFTGGEPLMRPQFPELVQIAVHHADHVVIFTNATLVTPENAELLARLGCEVHVSLDHVSLTIDDRVRGGTRATLRGLAKLREAGVRDVQIVMVLTSRNWTDAEQVMDFADAAGYACELIAVSVPAVHPLSLQTLPAADRRQLAALVQRRAATLGRPLYYAKLRRFLLTGSSPQASRCETGDSGIFVNSDGDIGVCASRPSPALGNIRDADPLDVLHAKAAATEALKPGDCVSMDCLVMT